MWPMCLLFIFEYLFKKLMTNVKSECINSEGKVLYNYVDVLVILLLCYFVMEWKLWYFFLLKQLSKISQLASRMCDGE